MKALKALLRPIRRNLLCMGAAAVLALGALPQRSMAQSSWPERPVRLIVPYAAGQGADVLARLLTQELQKTLGQSFVIDNRAGAGGNIGAAAVAKAAPDGYTFLLGTNATNAANEFLFATPGFSAATDLEGVGMIGLLPMVFSTSSPDFPANGIAELIAAARAKPNTLNVGLPSTTAQVVFAQFVKEAQAPLFAVNYKSSGQSMTDALGGQIPLVIDTVTASRTHIASGKLRALGITSLHASDMLPGVKPISEQGVPGFDVVAWDAVFAPRGTPPEVVRKLSEHMQRALQQPEMRRRMMEIGVEPRSMSAPELDAFVKAERKKWGATIQAAGIRSE
ncbi:tripartite tricarboxylate transporter substrate binding protein [Variovorax sp. Sphag1AA]|uniref:Bug family tripartite tricarboxylate transporter substrate binding protein n=1 Tax=Variovorax sp. Sphag1AA TaxID=2587027 RepID=UPI0017C47E12|nr:tripartite tricarboxylate transporter substrate-binding protein [Variovorax sp. Sphag1AA]MBB3181409.1 tripartite-type tricarboxylate transporter receptor subunit TctC [Variovorax sp. Sphag1AA]